MIFVDPDLLQVEAKDADFVEDDDDGGHINFAYEMRTPPNDMTYIRITPQIRDFIKLCHEKYGVIGFEYDLDKMGLNLGIMLRKDQDKETTA